MANIARKSVFRLSGSNQPASAVGANSDHVTIAPDVAPQRSAALRWLFNDIPYLIMLALAAVGVVLRLPVTYWVIITPIFAAISIAEGWRHFTDRKQKLGFVIRLSLDWAALLLAIYFLYNSGVQGNLNVNATSLVMMTLLALGTFVAGVQARVWQICAVGGVLFLVVPALGWLDQSPLLLVAGASFVLVLASVVWWYTQRTPAGSAGGAAKQR
jgi:hypothetical protein